MLNFKLISFHLKQTWIMQVAFAIAALVLILVSILAGQTFSPSSEMSDHSTATTVGVGELFVPTIIGGTMGLSFIMIIILLHKLFIKEIDRSYIGTWLTLPIARQKVIISKLFVIFLAIISFFMISTSLQLIIYGSLLKDFSRAIAFYVLGANFSMFVTSLLFTSITWILINVINKAVIALSLASGLAAISIIFFIMANTITDVANPFHPLKYLTILIFVQNPIKFDYLHPIKKEITDSKWWEYYPVILNIKDLAWKIPVPIIISTLPLAFGVRILKNKNLSI